MSRFLAPTLALLLVLLAPAAAQSASATPCLDAFRACDFTFVNTTTLQRFDISRRPDKPFTMRIVSKDPTEILGVLNTNDIVVEFISRLRVIPITLLGKPKFSPTQFKPFPRGWGSGIGHETFQGNQLGVAMGRCIRVHFSSYQLLNRRNGTVIENVNGLGKEAGKCVVFRAMKN